MEPPLNKNPTSIEQLITAHTQWVGRLAGSRGCRARSTDTQNEVTFTCPSHRQLKEVRPDVLDRAIVLQERDRFP
jgi:hypothetical protein